MHSLRNNLPQGFCFINLFCPCFRPSKIDYPKWERKLRIRTFLGYILLNSVSY